MGEQAKVDTRLLDSRMTGIGQLIQAERNLREVAVEQLKRTLQGVRDTIDNNHQSLQTGAQITMTHIEDVKKSVEKEHTERTAFEQQHVHGFQSVFERMEEMSLSFRAGLQEHSRRFDKTALDCAETIHDHARALQKVCSESEVNAAEVNSRISFLEERMATVETRILEAQQRHNESIDLLSQRAEKVTNTVELMRFDGGAISHNLSSLGARVAELQDFVAQNEHEMREVADRLRKKHDEELRLLRESIVLEREHMLAGIEGKLTHRLALESAAREQSMSVFVDSIDKKIGESSRLDGSLAKLKDRDEDSRSSPDGVEVSAILETPMASPQNVIPANPCGSQRMLTAGDQVVGSQTAFHPVVPQPGVQNVSSSEPPQNMLQRSVYPLLVHQPSVYQCKIFHGKACRCHMLSLLLHRELLNASSSRMLGHQSRNSLRRRNQG